MMLRPESSVFVELTKQVRTRNHTVCVVCITLSISVYISIFFSVDILALRRFYRNPAKHVDYNKDVRRHRATIFATATCVQSGATPGTPRAILPRLKQSRLRRRRLRASFRVWTVFAASRLGSMKWWRFPLLKERTMVRTMSGLI